MTTRWLRYNRTQTTHVIGVFPVEFDECFVTHCGLVLDARDVTVLKGTPIKAGRCEHCDAWARKVTE